MSSTMPYKDSSGGAEHRFREAFERLKEGTPRLLPVGTRVTQNNVAREAGTLPSALRGSRFPVLVADIRAWVESHGSDESQVSGRQKILAQRNRNRDLLARIAELEMQRDDALSKLVMAETRILELTMENERLRLDNPSKVAQIRPAEKQS